MTDAIDIKKTYKTRDGHKVRIYAVDGGDRYPVHGAYWNDESNFWESGTWSAHGVFYLRVDEWSNLDLVKTDPRIKRTVYLNIYDDSYDNYVSVCYSKESALAKAEDGIAACVKVDIDVEEGHGLT